MEFEGEKKDENIKKMFIEIPNTLYFQSGLRDFIYGFVKNVIELPDKIAYRFQSIVDELCNNAIEHGSLPDENIKIGLIYDKDKWLEVQVEDSGHGMSGMKAVEIKNFVEMKKNQTEKEYGMRGRGLAKIVSNWTDELEFIDKKNGGLIVRARKYIGKS